MKTALLLSGGMDSTSVAYWKKPDIALTINYGQLPAKAEIQAAKAVCEQLAICHEVIEIDLSRLGSGDLSAIPALAIAPVTEWWPFRNQLLISVAAMRAMALGTETLLIGTVNSDCRHADGTPEFNAAMKNLLALQEGALNLEAPAEAMSCAELIRHCEIPMDILAWSHSCHTANHACGTCSGCKKHYDAMNELGVSAY